jgi:hypothetical protein
MALVRNYFQVFTKLTLCLRAFSKIAGWTGRSDIGQPVGAATRNRNAVLDVNDLTFQRCIAEITPMTVVSQFPLPLFKRENAVCRPCPSSTSLSVDSPSCGIGLIVCLLSFQYLQSVFEVTLASICHKAFSIRRVIFTIQFFVAERIVLSPLFVLLGVAAFVATVVIPVAHSSTNFLSVLFPIYLFAFFNRRQISQTVAGNTPFALWLQTVFGFRSFRELNPLHKVRSIFAPLQMRIRSEILFTTLPFNKFFLKNESFDWCDLLLAPIQMFEAFTSSAVPALRSELCSGVSTSAARLDILVNSHRRLLSSSKDVWLGSLERLKLSGGPFLIVPQPQARQEVAWH